MDMYSYHEGEDIKKRGFASLKLPLISTPEWGESKRGEASFI